MKHTFKFGIFGGKVRMFSEEQMGIVIEKEPDVVCVYATDETHQDILCAIPLCHPKFLKGAEYTIDFCGKERVRVSMGDLRIVVDYAMKKCAVNQAIRCFGSDRWGQDIQAEWDALQ